MIALRPAVLCSVIACLFGSTAFANPITVALGDTVSVRFDGVHPGNGSAGMYNWTSNGHYAGLVYADPNANQFVTFCIERNEFTSSSWQPYTLRSLEDAPNPGPHMSHSTADALRGMWAQYFADVNTADEAAAFQNAVWYLLSNGSYSSILNSGQQGYFNNYTNSATWQSGLANLAVLSNSGFQDQLVQVTPPVANATTPEPGMLALGLLVIPAVLLRRKLAKA